MDNTKCYKHEMKGMCCCTCRHQIPINKHPINKDLGRGRISERMGYACMVPKAIESNFITFFDGEHGMCELWEQKSS